MRVCRESDTNSRRQIRHSKDGDAVDACEILAALSGNDRRGEAQACGLSEATLSARARPDLARQGDLSDRHEGTPLSEDTIEMAIARSIAGSTVRAPPTVET